MRKFIIIFCCLLLAVSVSFSQGKKNNSKDSIELRGRMLAFVTAFNNLNWEDFRSFFDENATAFLESDTLTLLEGKASIEQIFKPIFDETPKNVKGPPYLHLQPLNMNLYLQRNMAVVSFHLKRGNTIARRTFVWERRQKTWLIIHLHGSAVKPDL